ncbi:MAG TPA: PP2C family protein-serine/threonine phosphatase [Terracidiphilus sp.]|nr:PP2C family protein-serine/threonine phosphatase [Terracidiphilus sp.]
MNYLSPWDGIPLRSRVVLLLAVFCVFAGIGFAGDIYHLGRQSAPGLAGRVLTIGVFAVCYTASGIILRRKFWMAYLPLFALQSLCMTLLAIRFPDVAQGIQMNAAEAARLQSRLALDATAVIISIILGHTGFVHVSIREGRRYVKAETEKATLEGEMAAAREVQRAMVPEDLPAIRGYRLESVYRPAAEVGGDFFRVIGLESGRSLIVIGDVSGKGLRAAMFVSMIVGMLRTLSGFTEEPAKILEELNRRLCGQTQGGFATCLVIRLDDGLLTLANAGHLPPYVNGNELQIAGSLPLGLAESASYDQSFLEMRAGDRVVLLTDGIPEARNQEGLLLGFSKVESLLRDGASARTVAETAQHFGQNDDLTVISIARTA